MELQEKINKRIEELESDLKTVNKEYVNTPVYYDDVLDHLSVQINLIDACIKELKQLLN